MVKTTFVADTLRLLTQLTPATPEWRAKLIEEALRSPSVVVRDAAIQAIETWEEPALFSLLRRHVDPDAWLQSYKTTLIAQLEASP